MTWLSTHWMPLAVLMVVVVAASTAWCRLLALESNAQDERDEEMAKRMVDLCEDYNYPTDSFR